MKIRHSENPLPLRKKAYPEVGEQLDAIMKMAAALREQGIELPAEVHKWIDSCLEVKQRFKKHPQ